MGSPSLGQGGADNYDHSLKIVFIGDSGVGKSSLLHSFISGAVTDLSSTIGMDIKIKHITVGGKRLKLSIWDTAGQERFRTLTSSYYREAHGIILVYDVTQKQSFTNLLNLWTKEVEIYCTNKDCVKMLVGNKVDRESERAVSTEEGMEMAKQHGFMFIESSAATRKNVEKCFDDLSLKILEEIEKRQKEEKPKKPESGSVDIKPPAKPNEPPPSYPGPPSSGGGGGGCC